MSIDQEKTIYQNSDRAAVEEQNRLERVADLSRLLDHVSLVAACTGKEDKLLTYADMIAYFTGQELVIGSDIVTYEDGMYDEPREEDPVVVAHTKVNQVKEKSLAELEQLGFPTDYAVIAGDIISRVEKNNGQLEVAHKLARLNRPLSPEEVAMVREMLIDRYYTIPKEKGASKIVYESGTFIRNGSEKGIGDKLEIVFGPVDPELLDQYFMQAVETGLLYSSNMQMGAVECLIESGAITSISILPRELEEQGYSIEDFRRAPTPHLLYKVRETVTTNIPPHSY